MLYQIYLIPFWAIYTLSSHIDKNNSDVIVTYTGHSEVKDSIPQAIHKHEENVHSDLEKPKQNEDRDTDMNERERDKQSDPTEGNDVVFIPNDKEVIRNEDYKNVGVKDMIGETNIDGIMRHVKVDTESPNHDIIFISGKNDENIEKTKEKPNTQQKTGKKVKLNCNNLDCNNTVDTVCGGKEEERKWKYRLFMNECYFRKVNCGFKHTSNRYKIMPMESCKNIGGRYSSRPFVYVPQPVASRINETRRSFSSRRSLNMAIDGTFCSHSCPLHCTEDYDPQCAMSATGERRVFLNHCKLDYESCFYNAVWHRRPLSECVGGKKADMRQNRGFIGWLQRVGIVDKRGRLVLS
ncbi:uncharacterized protein LOC123704728 [Colias croceus]|uniref:uncharacterized protein LOC123704728 n=1 Tax=Colias crocea TaxID=72248 RepID=UPI001E2819CD|nr:uncharacterized protein LOC123704728 [Colias croceus]